MGVFKRVEPWKTVEADDTSSIWEMFMDPDQWPDASEFRIGVLEVEVSAISGATLSVQGCDQYGGEFITHASYTQATTTPSQTFLKKIAPYGASERLTNFLRWRIEGVQGTNWGLTFRINLNLK